MIHDIQIKGFRGIKSGSIKGFRDFNVLVGPNNSGKSAVIETLYLAGAAGRQAGLVIQKNGQENKISAYTVSILAKDFLREDPFLKVLGRHSYPDRTIDTNRLDQGSIRVQLRERSSPLAVFDLDAGHDRFFESREENVALFCLGSFPDQNEYQDRKQDYCELAGRIMGESISSLSGEQVVFSWHPDLTYFGKGHASWAISGHASDSPHTLFFDSAVAQRHISSMFYQHMLAVIPGWTQRIANHFGAIFDLDPTTFTVQFVPVQNGEHWVQGWIASKERPALPIDTFGDGARACFKLLAPLVALAEAATPEKPGLFLWEEPESFQNPSTLGRLLTQVVDIVRDKPVQIFCATHSLEVVAHLTHMLQKEKIAADDLRLFRLNLSEGELTSSWFDRDNLVVWLESGLDPRVWDKFLLPIQFSLREGD